MSNPRSLLAAASLCVVLGLTACGVRADEGAENPVLPSSERARSLVLPFDDHTLSPFEIQTIDYAEDLIIRDCMEERGMDWEVLPVPEEENTDPPHRRRYGVIEPEVAENYGYVAPIGSEDDRARAEVRESRGTLPRAEYQAAFGADGDGGCHGEARERVTDGVPDMDYNLLNSYIATGFDASQEEPEVIGAFAEWSTCMATRGFDYGTPLEAGDDARWAARESEPLPEEIEVATADVACKEEASVVEIWRSAEAEAQRGLIEEHPADFALFAQVREGLLERARAEIEALGP
ncbi:hypothetical protein [Nocardiopsis sp. FIRDI 009]|uniref:hypothetical protein n=1 Tax=Nocardiopsis sp. FIRDI 009 TaxID=714197 RepID=UPI000E2233F2|nr:hypothetical protein [Nocardiopsis sp. FIRDI 009]